MSPESLICFIIVGLCLVALWRQLVHLATELASLRTQMNRFISDIDSEKGTRRRINSELNDRIRALEKLPPLHDRSQEE